MQCRIINRVEGSENYFARMQSRACPDGSNSGFYSPLTYTPSADHLAYDAITSAAMLLADSLKAKGMIVFTETGAFGAADAWPRLISSLISLGTKTPSTYGLAQIHTDPCYRRWLVGNFFHHIFQSQISGYPHVQESASCLWMRVLCGIWASSVVT